MVAANDGCGTLLSGESLYFDGVRKYKYFGCFMSETVLDILSTVGIRRKRRVLVGLGWGGGGLR